MGEHCDPLLAGHEIRRDHDELVLGGEHQRGEVVGDRDLFVRRVLTRDLAGAIREHRGGHPYQMHPSRFQFSCQPVGICGRCIFRRRRSGSLGAHRPGHRSDGISVFTVPKGIERCRQLRHDGAGRDHVEIDEIVLGIAREVLVADVAAAGDGECIVGDEQLVVHPVIDAANVGCRREKASPRRESSARKRIEYPDFDIRVFAQMQEPPIFTHRIEIIHQNAHPHAAIRGQAHMIQQDPRGIVLVDDVVLNVERALGMVRERDEIGERLFARRQEVDTGQVLVDLLARHDAAERRRLGVRQRFAVKFLDVARQADAAGQYQGESHRVKRAAQRCGVEAGFTHRGMISGTLCAHANSTPH
jgi:hypothetical protein